MNTIEIKNGIALYEGLEIENAKEVFPLFNRSLKCYGSELSDYQDGTYKIPEGWEVVKEYWVKNGDWHTTGYYTFLNELAILRKQTVRLVRKEQNSAHGYNILPCPFCGNIPEWINEALPDSHYYLKCPECHIIMKEDRRDKVIGMWNRRAGLLYQEQPGSG